LCNKTPNELKEGSESASFWKLIGGKKDYASSPRMLDLDANPPRLFAISNAKGFVNHQKVCCFLNASNKKDSNERMLA